MSFSWEEARNILCVRLDNMGDVLMTTPALRALKESIPGRRLTLLASPAGSQITSMIPELDDVLLYEAPWMKSTPPCDHAGPDLQTIETLHRGRFDAAIIFTVYSQNPLPAAMLCYLADIPLRLAHCHENPYQLLTHWVPDHEPNEGVRHEVRRQLDLVSSIGCRTENERLSIRIHPGARAQATAVLRRLGLPEGRPWILIHPGASAPSRRYPPEHFARAAQILAAEHGISVVFTGSRDEYKMVESIRSRMDAPSFSLAGRLPLDIFSALIEQSPLLIANNTGPVHIAAAVGTPVVDLYALTNPQHAPWGVRHRLLFHDVPCKYCYKSVCPEGHHQCLRLVEPRRVVEAALQLLGDAQPKISERSLSCIP